MSHIYRRASSDSGVAVSAGLDSYFSLALRCCLNKPLCHLATYGVHPRPMTLAGGLLVERIGFGTAHLVRKHHHDLDNGRLDINWPELQLERV